MRIKVFRIIVVILFIITVLNLIYIQAIRGGYYYDLSMNNRIRVVPTEGWRGRIFDRNGVLLADNHRTYNVMVTPQDVKDGEELFSFLSSALGINERVLLRTYRLREVAPFEPVVVAENISREQAIVLEENTYRFPSLMVQESFRRIYPLRENSAHVLGYVGKMNESDINLLEEYGYSPQSLVGYLGVEEYYNEILRGDTGGLQLEVNSRGQQVRLLSFKEPVKGTDITLTIDSKIQGAALNLLQSKIGSIIVMDADNGEILALTNFPAFDPNLFSDPKSSSGVQGLLSNSQSPLLNRAIKGLYPPGSVFKIPVAMAALDLNKIIPATTFYCPGFYELGGRKFGCSHVHGPQNLIEAIAHSCNVYFFHVGLTVGADAIYRYADLLGLGNLTRVDIPYEKKGSIPHRAQNILSGKRWYTGNTLNFSIGQGDTLITPLQLTRMMATVFNDGLQVQPHIIRLIGDKAVLRYNAKQQLKIDPEIFRIIKQGLKGAVQSESGTAHVLDIAGFDIEGKTGTAQSFGEKGTHAWFVGYVAGAKRRLTFCVFLEHGGGSENACWVARSLLEAMIKDGAI
ncbi:MAG: penicillin-binding protein 2 [Candidatus Omnitrophica bacterium]|nr:penicillin-binding protein 2 [Candidatus Omnitrophota bacterium]